MKFSFCAAYDYLNNESIRKHFSELHIEQLQSNFIGKTEYVFAPSIRKYLDKRGLLSQFEENPDMQKWTPEMREVMFSEPKRVMLDIDKVKVYLIRKTVQEMCAKINFKDEKKFDYLDKISEGNKILVLDENRFYKYYRDGYRIVVCYFEKGKLSYNYTMFNFELDMKFESKPNVARAQEIEERFIQLVMFLEYAPHTTKLLAPNQKDGTRNDGKVINDSTYGLIIVDSEWNKIIVRTDGFAVGADTGGFLALRAYGTGRYQRRFVWIMPYEKQGYTRGVIKEKVYEEKGLVSEGFVIE